MAFDPTKPADHSEIKAQELRDQMMALKTHVGERIEQTVPLLNMELSHPPTQAELQALADKVDEIISQLIDTQG